MTKPTTTCVNTSTTITPPIAPISSIPLLSSSASHPLSNLLLVTNLSFFCERQHLYELFDQYGHIQQMNLFRNEWTTQISSPCALVTMESPSEAREMMRILSNHLFMGRKMR